MAVLLSASLWLISILFTGRTLSLAYQCNHGDTGFYTLNSAECQFYRCSEPGLNRLHCTTRRQTNVVQAALEKYAAISSTPLHLDWQISQDNDGNIAISGATFANVGPLIHRLSLDLQTYQNGYHKISVDGSIMTALTNLTILDLYIRNAGIAFPFTATTFRNAPKLEFLSVNADPSYHIYLPDYIASNESKLQCIDLYGRSYACNCQMQNILQTLYDRSPPSVREHYINALAPTERRQCLTLTGATCQSPSIYSNRPVAAIHLLDCPGQPVPGIPALYTTTTEFSTVSTTTLSSLPEVQLETSCGGNNFEVLMSHLTGTENFLVRFKDQESPDCQGQLINGSLVLLSSTLTSCGTEVTSISSSEYLIQNTVKVIIKSEDTEQKRLLAEGSEETAELLTYEYPVQCRLWHRERVSSSLKAQAPDVNISAGANSSSEFGIELVTLKQTSSFEDYRFEVRRHLSNGPSWELAVDDCWATPNSDPDNRVKLDLIKAGCIDRTFVRKHEAFQDDEQKGHRYHVAPFHFPQSASKDIHITCKVRICHAELEGFDACLAKCALLPSPNSLHAF